MKINDLYKKANLVFDIGANIGSKTSEFIKNGSRVICFEPQLHLIQQLYRRFLTTPAVTIVHKGLSSYSGITEMAVCEKAPNLSTLSEQWKEAVVLSGRFSSYSWNKKEKIEVITLDNAIRDYGKPQFCKIDVEGYEKSVLEGLSIPIDSLSFEFTREFIDDAIYCVNYCNQLGLKNFNFAIADNDSFSLLEWVDSFLIIEEIKKHFDNTDLWGDIYAKL